MKLAVQEQLLPGRSLQEKFAFALDAGFDAIELRGKGDFHFAGRLTELKRALADGVEMPTVCVDMPHFIGDFDPAKRKDAIQQLRSQLTVIGELGGIGVMTPASWGSSPAACRRSSRRAAPRRTARCWPRRWASSASTRTATAC
ncbi:sugar phosphate isomerase/epimerase family protein [Nonomuraea thailandensis]